MVLQQINIFGESTKVVLSKPKTSSVNQDDDLLSKKYEQLYNIYDKIYESLNIDLFEQKEIIIIGKTIIAYPEERQAELLGTQFLPLDERIEIHRRFLNDNQI